MSERREEVKPVAVYLVCDECGEDMKPNGTSLPSNPPQYPHECANGHILNVMGKQYPHIDYEKITTPKRRTKKKS